MPEYVPNVTIKASMPPFNNKNKLEIPPKVKQFDVPNFGPNINFLFETHDLQFASPATISRMGMIFLSEKDVDGNEDDRADRATHDWGAGDC